MFPEDPSSIDVPPVADDAGAPTSPTRRSRALVTVGSIVTVGLVGLGAAAIAFGGGGASSPEEAVRHLATAVDQQDVLAVVATMAPDETRSLPDLVQRVNAKTEELDLGGRLERAFETSGDVEAAGDKKTKAPADSKGPFGDVDLKVTDLEVRTTTLSDDIAKVEIIGGTLSWDVPEGSDVVDPERFLSPFGFFAAGFPLSSGARYDADLMCSDFEDEGYDPSQWDDEYDGPTTLDECKAEVKAERDQAAHGSVDFAKLHREADDDHPAVFAMTVKRDGGWYVSPFFTAAEYFRLGEDGAKVARYDVDPGPAAETPTGAVQALSAALETGDSVAVANVLASELSVWRVYHDSVDDDDDGTDPVFAGESVKVDNLKTHEDPIDDDRVRVVIDSVQLVWTEEQTDWDAVPDDYYEDEDEDYDDDAELPTIQVTHTMTVDGDCISETTSPDQGSDDPTCLDTVEGGMAKALGLNRISMVAVTDRDGWAVSPIETIADYLRTFVDHLTGPLLERLLGGYGTDRTPTGHLELGDNDVRLDDAGLAVVELELDTGTFATVTTPDDNVAVEFDDSSTVLTPGTHTAVVTGPIGARTAKVVVQGAKAEPLSSTAADGSTTPPVTGNLEPGELRVYSLSYADFTSAQIESGDDLVEDYLDEHGDYVDPLDSLITYDPYSDDEESGGDGSEDNPTPPETVYLVLSTYGFDDDVDDDEDAGGPGSTAYSVAFVPSTGGFAGADPMAATIDLDSYDTSLPVGIVAGQRFTLTLQSSRRASVELSCPSGQFDDVDAAGMSFPSFADPAPPTDVAEPPVDDSAAGMSFNEFVGGDPSTSSAPTTTIVGDDASSFSFGYDDGLRAFDLRPDEPFTAWLRPTVTEVCSLYASEDYEYDDGNDPDITSSTVISLLMSTGPF